MTGDKVDKETMLGAHFSDIEVAGQVRMLMPDDLSHEAVCIMGRDRIMYLSQQVERLEQELDNAHAAICAAIDSGEVQNEFVMAKLRKGIDNQPQDANPPKKTTK